MSCFIGKSFARRALHRNCLALYVIDAELGVRVHAEVELGQIAVKVLGVDMLMAYYLADRDALQAILSAPDKFYAAAPFTFLFASLLVLIFGAGLFSLDALLAWIWRKKTEPPRPVESTTSQAGQVKVA